VRGWPTWHGCARGEPGCTWDARPRSCRLGQKLRCALPAARIWGLPYLTLTSSMMVFLGGPSFQDGSGSPDAGICARAEMEGSVTDKAGTREVAFKRRLVNAKFSSHAILATITNLRDTERRFESPDVAGLRPCRQLLMGDRAEHPQWAMGESLTPPCGVSQRQQQIRRLLHRPPHHQHTLRRRTPRGTVGAQLGTRLAGQYGADSAGTGIMDNPAVATTAPPSMTPNISRR
jgi:hypothetical protein